MLKLLTFALISTICLMGCGYKSVPAPTSAGGSAILMVVTTHDQIDADHKTGLWLEEFAVPYKLFRDAGHAVTVASPKGGDAPIDPASMKEGEAQDADALAALKGTKRLADVDIKKYAAVFFPGGHGTMFDLPENKSVQAAVAHFMETKLPTAFVCHGPAALVGATLSDGSSVVQGRKVTGFTNSEEAAVKLTEKMPFLLETRLQELGASFEGAEDWAEHVVVDGNLITGQNPASSGMAAKALLKQLDS